MKKASEESDRQKSGKQDQQEMEALQIETLSETRRQFETLLGHLPGMVYRCLNDRNWAMEFVSDGCVELTGYTPVDLVSNKTLSYNDLIIKEDQQRIWDEVQQAIDQKKPFTLEYRIRCADSKIKWIWEKGKGIYNEHGQLRHIEGFISDITDRKLIEKNLIAAKEKAEESDKLKTAFLSNMSHEIRTPMNAILGFSTLISEPGVSEKERAEYIRIIRERGNDLMRIIDDIIDVAKIESDLIKVEIRECKINILLNNLVVTLNEVKRKTNKTKVVLSCLPENPDNDFTIPTDQNRLRQIMTNLIENGLKYTDEGNVEFGYTMRNIESVSYIEFFVRDTGIGIPKEMSEVIFERFRQGNDHSIRKYGGTGLGLTISKNLTRILGGEIRFESIRGKGSTFYVLLPMQVPPEKIVENIPSKYSVSSIYNWSDKVILVVEDEDSNFFLMSRILKQTGVKLVWVKNGLEAIECCKTQVFNLILMDIRMPLMDGYEATQIIRKVHKNLPIIAQTAYALKGEREKSLAAGCDNYISKPIDSREMLAMLGKYLEDKS